jgi:hypothetical protein
MKATMCNDFICMKSLYDYKLMCKVPSQVSISPFEYCKGGLVTVLAMTPVVHSQI